MFRMSMIQTVASRLQHLFHLPKKISDRTSPKEVSKITQDDPIKQRELDDIKNRFISNLTHELRTPVVAMQKAITLLLGPSGQSAGPLNETQVNFLNIVDI